MLKMPLYITVGTSIVLLLLQGLGIVPAFVPEGHTVMAAPFIIAIFAFFGGFFVAGLPIVQQKITSIFAPAPNLLAPTPVDAAAPLVIESEPIESPTVAAPVVETTPVHPEKLPRPAAKTREFPVEDLGNGLINALGEGLGVVIDTTVSAGSGIAAEIQNGAKVSVSVTRNGIKSYYNFIQKKAQESKKR